MQQLGLDTEATMQPFSDLEMIPVPVGKTARLKGASRRETTNFCIFFSLESNHRASPRGGVISRVPIQRPRLSSYREVFGRSKTSPGRSRNDHPSG